VCQKGIIISPSRAVLLRDPSDAAGLARGSVKLLRREGTFRITKVDTGNLELQIKTTEVLPGQEYQMLVTHAAVAGAAGPSRVGHSIYVETDDPTQPRIVIPLWLPATAARIKVAGGK